jgi:5-methylcytosine-specific restriction endonuclease McrA
MENRFWKINSKVMKYLEDRDPVLASLIKAESEETGESIVNRLTNDKRYEICKRQFWKCNICGCKLKYNKYSKWEGETAHIDHIYPFSKKESYTNGPALINESSNLQALCPNCNLKKGGKIIQ